MNASAKRSLSRRHPLTTLFGDRQFNISSGKVAIITTSRSFEYRGVDRRALTTAQTVHRKGCPKKVRRQRLTEPRKLRAAHAPAAPEWLDGRLSQIGYDGMP